MMCTELEQWLRRYSLQGFFSAALAVLFVILCAGILLPSLLIVFSNPNGNGTSGVEMRQPPKPPEPVSLETIDPGLDLQVQEAQVKSQAQRVNAYTQQVNAYVQDVSAYKTFVETSTKSRDITVYELVVKGTLLSLMTPFLTAVLGFIFVKGGVAVAINYLRVRKAEAVQKPDEIRVL